jgi:hypothetical protein
MVWCEIFDENWNSVVAQFEIVPHVGDEIEIFVEGKKQIVCAVKTVRHVSLAVHGNEHRPRIKLWVDIALKGASPPDSMPPRASPI